MNQLFCFQIQSLLLGANYVLILLFLFSYGFSQNVIISEIYRDPPGSETALGGGASHEFIEITNLSCNNFSLENLLITDGADADSLISWGSIIVEHKECLVSQDFLLPGQTALILDPDYSEAVEKNPGSALSIKNGTVLLKVDDRDLGNGLAGDDGIILYRGNKKKIRKIIARASNEPVFPDSPVSGKISLSDPPNREGFSVTPGMFLFDSTNFSYRIDTLSAGNLDDLKNGFVVEWKSGSVDINNKGVLPCSLICLQIVDEKESSVLWNLKSVFGVESRVIDNGTAVFRNQKSILVLNLPLDDVNYYLLLDTNSWHIDISSVWSPEASIVISEIFPKATQYEPEWIELFNNSSMSINLNGWKLGNSEDTIEIIDRDYHLGPGQYAVITKKTVSLSIRYPGIESVIEPVVWHTLHNNSDTVILLNPRSVLTDMICYDKKWFNSWSNGSLERINFSEDLCDSLLWEPVQVASPGMPNGVQAYRSVENLFFDIGPIPFTPDNDGKDDYLQILLKLPPSHSIISLSIFSFDGRKIYQIDNLKQGKFLWDGKQSNGKPVMNGPVFIAAEIKYPKGTKMMLKKGVLWR